ncbi:hypothetical protein Y032_0384g407 [Ancylostoma ceylanicum]|nr:hypothetical protein Y032_0384g407 [Ancylostoma ceylanicum]
MIKVCFISRSSLTMLGPIVLSIVNMFVTTLFLANHITYCGKKGGHRAQSGYGAANQSPAEASGPPMKSTASEERRRDKRAVHGQEVKEKKEKSIAAKKSDASKQERKSSELKSNPKKSGEKLPRRKSSTKTLDGGATMTNDMIAAAEEMAKECGDYDNLNPNEAEEMDTALFQK